MIEFEPEPHRGSLGFSKTVVESFKFLTDEYSFHLTMIEPTLVTFESPSLFINIYHGRRSFELGFEIGEKVGPRDLHFSIGELIYLVDSQKGEEYQGLQASTQDRVGNLVPRLASLVKEYAADALKGNAKCFEALAALREQRGDALLKKWRLSGIRESADKAWKDKNLDRIVELYESMQGDLSAVESKRLQYAKKHTLSKK